MTKIFEFAKKTAVVLIAATAAVISWPPAPRKKWPRWRKATPASIWSIIWNKIIKLLWSMTDPYIRLGSVTADYGFSYARILYTACILRICPNLRRLQAMLLCHTDHIGLIHGIRERALLRDPWYEIPIKESWNWFRCSVTLSAHDIRISFALAPLDFRYKRYEDNCLTSFRW